MLGYLLILAISIFIWVIALEKSGFELFSPSSVFSLGMIASLLLAMIGMSSWNDVTLSSEVISIVIIGELAFVIGSVAVAKIPFVSRLTYSNALSEKTDRNGDSDRKAFLWKYVLLGLVLVFAILLRTYETLKIADSLGISGDSIFEISKQVRNEYAVFNNPDAIKVGVGYSLLERQLEKIVIAIGFVSAFLLGRELSREGRKVYFIVAPLAILFLCVLYTLLMGSRGLILRIVVAAVASFAISAFNASENHRRLALRLLLYCSVLAIIVTVIFYFLSFVVRRGAGSGPIEYISFYFGCGIPSFERLVESGATTDAAPGVYTFYYLMAFLYKFDLIADFPSYSLAWVKLGSNSSNVFTCFARYYVEFGLTGVVVLSALSGGILSIFYARARHQGSAVSISLAAFFTPYIFDMAREEFVFSRCLSMNYLLIIALIVIITFFMTDPSPVKTVKSWFAQRGKAK